MPVVCITDLGLDCTGWNWCTWTDYIVLFLYYYVTCIISVVSVKIINMDNCYIQRVCNKVYNTIQYFSSCTLMKNTQWTSLNKQEVMDIPWPTVKIQILPIKHTLTLVDWYQRELWTLCNEIVMYVLYNIPYIEREKLLKF